MKCKYSGGCSENAIFGTNFCLVHSGSGKEEVSMEEEKTDVFLSKKKERGRGDIPTYVSKKKVHIEKTLSISPGIPTSNTVSEDLCSDVKIYHIDVETGDATFIRYTRYAPDNNPDNAVVIDVLIDGGYYTLGGSRVLQLIGSANPPVKELHIVCTHMDADHAGGLRYLLERREFDNVYFFYPENGKYADAVVAPHSADTPVISFFNVVSAAVSSDNRKAVAVKDVIAQDGNRFMLSVIASGGSVIGKNFDDNPSSIGLALKHGKFCYYIAGDLPSILEDDLELTSACGKVGVQHFCVTKATHHGSKDHTSVDFLNLWKPSHVFISSGRMHGHPDHETIMRLNDCAHVQRYFLTNCCPNRYRVNPDFKLKQQELLAGVGLNSFNTGKTHWDTAIPLLVNLTAPSQDYTGYNLATPCTSLNIKTLKELLDKETSVSKQLIKQILNLLSSAEPYIEIFEFESELLNKSDAAQKGFVLASQTHLGTSLLTHHVSKKPVTTTTGGTQLGCVLCGETYYHHVDLFLRDSTLLPSQYTRWPTRQAAIPKQETKITQLRNTLQDIIDGPLLTGVEITTKNDVTPIIMQMRADIDKALNETFLPGMSDEDKESLEIDATATDGIEQAKQEWSAWAEEGIQKTKQSLLADLEYSNSQNKKKKKKKKNQKEKVSEK